MVTVYTHKNISIQVKAISKPHEIGYTIDHPSFAGQCYNLVQDAINAIDRMSLKKAHQPS